MPDNKKQDGLETTQQQPVEKKSVPKPIVAEATSKPASTVKLTGSVGAETKPSSFVDTVYQQINSVLGGSNSNQFLCLTIPGQALSAEDFSYDYKNNATKGLTVEANESRLANKLFDPCRMTGGDNGFTLPYQYRSALDMLTPKLNGKIAEAKNQLRQLLMTEYPYNFDDDNDKKYTLQQVFFNLYEEYIKEVKVWADEQEKIKKKLRTDYPDTSASNNEKYNDAYLSWYETNAEVYLNAINEKMSKMISVFTPNDMKILEGILDSGSGAELQEARQTLENTRKITPEGGYVYPVKFNPTNWFELLNTSFTAVDLLKTPDVLGMQLQMLVSRRMKLSSRIDSIAELIPDKSTIEDAKKAVSDAQATLNTAQSSLITAYGEGIKTLLDTAFSIAPLFEGGAIPANIIAKLAKGVKLSEGKIITDLIADLNTKMKESANAQQVYVSASQKLAVATEKAISEQTLDNLGALLHPLKEQAEELDSKIKDIQMQIQLSSVFQPTADKDGKVQDTETFENSVAPMTVPEGYTQVVISASASDLKKESLSKSNSSVSTSGASFWFCGYHSENSSASSAFNSFTEQSDTSIQIGMNVAKIGIEREWFNPGVFALSRDMFNVTTSKISPPKAYNSVDDNRLNDMASTIFPCYPVAIIVARDISIKLVSSSSISSEFSESVENHASTGGGFLFFSGSSSSSSSSSSTGVHASSTDNTVTLKFDTPQILGYYLEATPPDKSSYLDDISEDEKSGYVTISEFVNAYKKILEDMKKAKSED